MISIYGLLRSLVDPVTRLVAVNPQVGWANNIEKGDECYLKGRNKRLESLGYAERDMWMDEIHR